MDMIKGKKIIRIVLIVLIVISLGVNIYIYKRNTVTDKSINDIKIELQGIKNKYNEVLLNIQNNK